MTKIFEIASSVSTPLALAGFIACVVFFVFRQIVAKNIFPRLTSAVGAGLLRHIIDRLFVLALVAMCLGFGAYLVPLAFGASRVNTLPTPAAATPATAPPAADFGAVSSVVRSQLDSNDYVNAWMSVGEALKTEPARAELLELQTDVAMRWIRDVHRPEGKTFGEAVDPLVPVLYRTVERHKTSDKPRAADALAHIGWVNYLKERDSVFGLDVEGRYREAVQLDPDNPFAHAMWGHWLIGHGNRSAEARTQFTAALKSGRERGFVREFQFSALGNVTTDENALETIRVCNDMRKNGEPLPSEDRRSWIIGTVYFMSRQAVLADIDRFLPADEHLATLQWLRRGVEESSSGCQEFFVARLSEAVGDYDTALRTYVMLLDFGFSLSGDIRAGIARCRRAAPDLKSEAELLTERLRDENADVRRQAVQCLSALLADGDGKVAPSAFVPALRDPDEEVRDAARESLVRAGKQAVPVMLELLAGPDSADRDLAARVLAKIGADAKSAIPALVEAMKKSPQEHKRNQAAAIGQIACELATNEDRDSLDVLRAALRAEQEAKLDPDTIAPLSEAIDALSK